MYHYQNYVVATQFHPEWNNQAIASLKQAYGDACQLEPTELSLQTRLQSRWFNELELWLNNALIGAC